MFERAELCLRERKVELALRWYGRAERAGYASDLCSGARWMCHMLRGDFSAAWAESRQIEARGGHDPNRFWSGTPLRGKRVMVRCLHGLGDTLQYIRYVPLLRRESPFVAVEAQPALRELLSVADIADCVMTWGEAEPPYDEQIEVIELPRIFETTLATVPASVPYLSIPEGSFPARADGALRVGIVWSSSRYNPARSVPMQLFRRLLESLPDIAFFSFQADPERADLRDCAAPVEDAYEPSGSILKAAQRLKNMDLLLTVDTMMAHLAGALAIPVWTMLPFEADWRWMLEGSETPWYPTMRLFRQPSPDDWNSVLRQVAAALKELAPTPVRRSESGILRTAARDAGYSRC